MGEGRESGGLNGIKTPAASGRPGNGEHGTHAAGLCRIGQLVREAVVWHAWRGAAETKSGLHKCWGVARCSRREGSGAWESPRGEDISLNLKDEHNFNQEI